MILRKVYSCFILMTLLTGLSQPVSAELDQQRRNELLNLVEQDCGSCHGITMNGGLGPSLTPAALKDKPKPAMVATILHGRPGTAMPPWSKLLTEQEVSWIVDALYAGLGNAN